MVNIKVTDHEILITSLYITYHIKLIYRDMKFDISTSSIIENILNTIDIQNDYFFLEQNLYILNDKMCLKLLYNKNNHTKEYTTIYLNSIVDEPMLISFREEMIKHSFYINDISDIRIYITASSILGEYVNNDTCVYNKAMYIINNNIKKVEENGRLPVEYKIKKTENTNKVLEMMVGVILRERHSCGVRIYWK
jgi:hypothetical protein